MELKGFRDFRQADDGLIGMIVVLIMMIVFVFIILTITANIVPIAIFMILAIVFVLIIKHVLFGGIGMGIITGASGAAKSAGKEGVGLIKSARREYKKGW